MGSIRFCAFMPTHTELVDIICLHLTFANNRADNTLYRGFDYNQIAENFLNKIARRAEKAEKNMFYSGANIENLIEQTNRALKKRGNRDFSQAEFEETMLKCAEDERSQPYGITNMNDLASFWLDAQENKYADAGGSNLFPFSGLRDSAASPHAYDRYMYKQIKAKISELQDARSNTLK